MMSQPDLPPGEDPRAPGSAAQRRGMFSRRRSELRDDGLVDGPARDTEVVERPLPVTVRGGISLWAIFTGTMTALGALLLGAAITGGIVAATNMSSSDLTTGASSRGIWTAIAFCSAVFIAFTWGGYTAGRMARGMGMLNGVLVPAVTIIVCAGVIALVDVLGANVSLSLPYFGTWTIPLGGTTMTTDGTITGIAALALMVIGGMLGGMRGVAWHRRLEDPTVAHPVGRRIRAA